MSEYKERLKKVETIIRTAQGYEEFETCQDLYEFFGIADRRATNDEIKLIIGAKLKYYQSQQSSTKWGRLAIEVVQSRSAIEYMMLDNRDEYDKQLITYKIEEVREHFISRTKRDNELDPKEKIDIIEEGKERGLSDTQVIDLINKWIIDIGVREVEVHSSDSPTTSTPFDVLLGKTYYEILGVPEDADSAQIKKIYDEEHQRYINSRDKARATAKWVQVVEAWECLRDPTKRREYDEKLKQPRTPVPTGEPRLVVECESDYTFKDVRRGTTISKKIVIRNPEGGLLQGTIKSDSPWLEPDRSKVLEKHEQELYINVLTSKIPPKMYKTEGSITIDTNGGPPYIIPFEVFLENYEIELQRFRKTWPPLCAAAGGLIWSFVSQNHFSGFLIGMFILGGFSYLLSKKGFELTIAKGIDLSKYPSVLIQGMSIGVVVLAIIVHLGNKSETGKLPSPKVKTESPAPQAFPSVNISGEWQGNLKIERSKISGIIGSELHSRFSIKQTSSNLTGTMVITDPANPGKKEEVKVEGKIDGNQISLGKGFLKLTGSVNNKTNEVQGRWGMQEETEGSWRMVKKGVEAEKPQITITPKPTFEEQRKAEEERHQREVERERQETANLQQRQQRQLEEQRKIEEQRRQREVERQQQETAALQQRQQRQLEEQRKIEEQRRQREVERLQRETANLQQRHQRETANLQQRNEQEIANLEQRHQRETANLQQRHQREAGNPRRHQRETANLQQRHQRETANLQQRNEQETANLEQRHQRETASLQQRLEAANLPRQGQSVGP